MRSDFSTCEARLPLFLLFFRIALSRNPLINLHLLSSLTFNVVRNRLFRPFLDDIAIAIAAIHAKPVIQGRYPGICQILLQIKVRSMEYIGGQDQSGEPSNEEEEKLHLCIRNRTETQVSEIMQPGRPFLRSLQSSFLKHVQGKVHCESETLRVRRRKQRCLRSERDDSDLREAPLERSDIANRVLAAVKACSMVDSAKVTEDAIFEEELQLQRGDVVVLVLAVLKKYGLSLSYVEARRMTTCTELIDYIESQVCQDDSSSNEDH